MSPEPILGSVAADLYNDTTPLGGRDAANAYLYAHLCQAVGLMWQKWEDLADPVDPDVPAWAPLVSVDRAPDWALPWLAQLSGTTLVQGAASADHRDRVRRLPQRVRGRPDTFLAAVKRTLTGSKGVRLYEFHNGSAWRILVITRPSETPVPEDVVRAINSQKPAGIVVDHVVSESPLWNEAPEDLTWNDVHPTATWDDVTPGDLSI